MSGNTMMAGKLDSGPRQELEPGYLTGDRQIIDTMHVSERGPDTIQILAFIALFSYDST
jgi:hypothetical protein